MTLEEKQSQASRRPDADVALPVIAPSQTFSVVTEQISSVPLQGKVPPALVCRILYSAFFSYSSSQFR